MAEQPNILLITADQFRWDCMGCMGNDVIQTPNLDALAARGMRFANGFSPNPICVPARATIMTGNYSHVCTGTKNNGGRIGADQPLLTEVLKGVGYRTYKMGKLHFTPYSPPDEPRLVHGFEHVDLTESGRLVRQFDPEGKLSGLEDYCDYLKEVGWPGYSRSHGVGNNDVRPCPSPLPQEHYVDHWIADCTLRQIDLHQRQRADQPFFMWMSSPKPHSPYDPPRPYDNLYDPRDMPMPVGSVEDLAARNPAIERIRYTHAADSLSPAAWQVIRSYYYGNITFLDAMIGRVLDRLAELGQLDNTLVVFTADHGDLIGDFGSVFKANHLNASVRIPYLVAGPGVARGCTSRALVGLQDILPTFAAAAGATVGQEVHGCDLSAHLAAPETHVRDHFYAASIESPGQTAMVTDGKWKYVYSEANATEELYDQENDAHEEYNRIADPDLAGLADEMRGQLRACAEELGDTDILDGDGLACSEVDRAGFKDLPSGSGMGWRWF